MPGLPSEILITGATGFIGQHLTQRLLSKGCKVSTIVLPEENTLLPSDVKSVSCNIVDTAGVAAAVQAISPDMIVHLSAAGVTNPSISFLDSNSVNVIGTINLLEAVRNTSSLQRLVLIGSSYEYGARRSDDTADPFNAYGASKLAAWAYARAAYNTWGLPVVWVRPFQVYGPGQPAKTFIPSSIHAALSGQDFRMTAGAQQRDFIYIEDIVEGLIAIIAAQNVVGRTLDLGTGKLTPLIDVVKTIWNLTQAQGHILAGALPYRTGEVSAIAANVQRTRLLTNWEATKSLQKGLQLTIDNIRDSLRN